MMDLRRLAVAVVTVAMSLVVEFGCCSFGNVVTFDVKHKFAGKEKNLSALRAHDIRRHSRLLSTVDVDLPLGGNGHPSETGLYFAKIGLGNPSKDYYVQVDTGSDLLWVNCAGCGKCPTKSDLGIELTLYDPRRSSTSSLVFCDQDFCTSTYDGQLPGCKPNLQCQYNVVYGDGSSTAGYFVKDTIQLQQVTGNLKTESTNGTVIFGLVGILIYRTCFSLLPVLLMHLVHKNGPFNDDWSINTSMFSNSLEHGLFFEAGFHSLFHLGTSVFNLFLSCINLLCANRWVVSLWRSQPNIIQIFADLLSNLVTDYGIQRRLLVLPRYLSVT